MEKSFLRFSVRCCLVFVWLLFRTVGAEKYCDLCCLLLCQSLKALAISTLGEGLLLISVAMWYSIDHYIGVRDEASARRI